MPPSVATRPQGVRAASRALAQLLGHARARASRQSGCVGSAALGAGAAAAANPSSASAQPRACRVWRQRLIRTGIEQQWIAKTAAQNFEKPYFFRLKMDAVSWPRGRSRFRGQKLATLLKVNINSNAVHLLVTNFRTRNCVHFQSRWHRFFRFLEKVLPISGPEMVAISGQEKVAFTWLGHSKA